MNWNSCRYNGRGRRPVQRIFWFGVMILGVLAVTSYMSGCGRWHHRHWEHKDLSPAEMKERMGRRSDWVLKTVDATPEQRDKISAVLEGFIPEAIKFREDRKALRERFKKTLSADEIDEAELAEIRTATKALMEKSMERGLDTIFEISKVLTPEQRRKLIEKWEKRR